MATKRIDLKGYIYQQINISSILSILGEVTTRNRRIYSGWPQEQPELSATEPAEGWLCFHELSSLKAFNGSHIEDHTIQFNIWSTLQSNNDNVIDVLDSLFDNPSVDQYGISITDDWVILLTQRITTNEMYEEAIKMYRKMVNYQMRTTKIPFRVGA